MAEVGGAAVPGVGLVEHLKPTGEFSSAPCRFCLDNVEALTYIQSMKFDAARALAALATAAATESNVANPGRPGVAPSYYLDALRAAGATDQDLLEAHRAGLVALARIDLVAAYPEDRVRASELRAFGGYVTFHTATLA